MNIILEIIIYNTTQLIYYAKKGLLSWVFLIIDACLIALNGPKRGRIFPLLLTFLNIKEISD